MVATAVCWTTKQCRPLSGAGGKVFLFVCLFFVLCLFGLVWFGFFLAGREGAAQAGSAGRDQGLLHGRHSQLQMALQWTKAEPISHIRGISVKIYLRKCRRERKQEGKKKREKQMAEWIHGRVDTPCGLWRACVGADTHCSPCRTHVAINRYS